MAEKRKHGDDRFLDNHFSSGGNLGVSRASASVKGAGPESLKHIVLGILQKGETVARALKRLRPAPKQAGGNKKRRQIGGKDRQRLQDAKAAADAFLSELRGDDAVAQEQEAQKKQQFDQLTEAASELLDLGFEDIYQDNREAIAATLGRGHEDGQNKRTYIWHDDGMSAPRTRDLLDNVTTFRDLPASAARSEAQHGAASSAKPGTPAAAAAGAVTLNTAVPHSYDADARGSAHTAMHPSQPAPSPAQPERCADVRPIPALPTLAPLPPAPNRPAPPASASHSPHQGAAPPPPAAYPGYPPAQQPYYPAPYPPANHHQYWQQAQQYPQQHPSAYPPTDAAASHQGQPAHAHPPPPSYQFPAPHAGGWSPPAWPAQGRPLPHALPPGQPHWRPPQHGPPHA